MFEGTNSNPGACNPTTAVAGCDGTGVETPPPDREGLDPINPGVDSRFQTQSPVTQGDYKSHYVLLMLGASTSF